MLNNMPKKRSPTAIFIGKPTNNMFICGAILAITAKLKLMRSSIAITGAAILTAMPNMLEKKNRILLKTVSLIKKLPGGTNLKL